MAQISINKMEKYAKSMEKPNYTFQLRVGEETLEVAVKHHITMTEAMDFVNYVVGNLFREVDGAMYYIPECEKMFWFQSVLRHFTNIKHDLSSETLVALQYDTDLQERIEEKINSHQLFHLECAIEEAVSLRKAEMTAAKANDLSKFGDAIGKLVDDIGGALTVLKDKDPNWLAQIAKTVYGDKASEQLG